MALPCALKTNTPWIPVQAGMTATWAPAFKLNASVKYSHCPNQQQFVFYRFSSTIG